MKKDFFYECDFISREMWFHTYTEFCDLRYGIKRLYNGLSRNGKEFYKWYVYANIHMGETFKNAIWDFLNDYDDGRELLRLEKYYKSH